MSSVDNRVVKMQFDNATFKREALATKGALEQVDAAVAKTGGNKGLLDMGKHMDTVRVKASAMQVATVTAIANIANRAVNAGINIAKSLSIDPIKAGFDEYELKMKSIQTILSNTKGENLASVTEALDKLNEYSDKTIYNFASMTENIGKLTTAGVGLDDATNVVKGFHNMVALAGGDATAAAGAMEQFSYGLQAGTIKAMDWMSISNRGLGSQSLQKAFFETARAVGSLSEVPLTTTFEEWTKTQGGFKASLEQGWLTSDVATKALTVMTGDIKDVQQLMAMGFDEKTALDMLKIADSAVESATKVRTFSAFMDTTKEALGSGWAKIMEVIFGDFNEATKLFTTLSNITSKYINMFFGYISRLLLAFDKLGGRTAVLETIKNILSPILAILGLIAKAWTTVFGGGDTGSGLATFAKALQHITRPLRLLGELISGQITPFEFFARLIKVVSNGVRNLLQYVGGLISPLTDLVGIKLPSGNGIFDFFDRLVELLKSAGEQFKTLRKTGMSVIDSLNGISFDLPGLPSMPELPKLGGLPDFGSMFGGSDTKINAVADAIGNVNTRMSEFKFDASPMKGFLNGADATSVGLDNMAGSAENAATVGDKVAPAIEKAWAVLKDFFSDFNMEDLMASFNLAVLSTFMISVSRFFNTLSKSFAGFVGTGEAVNGVLTSAQGALESFQTGARAKLIMAIGIAIGILAVSLWLLSRIPMDKMVTGLAGMAGIMLIMKTGVDSITKAVEKMEGKGTALKLTGLSIALLALGAAVLLLATAFLILNKVDWSSMLKGLATIIVVMKTMEMMGKVGEHGAKNLMATAFTLGALAISFTILAGALLLFQLVKWEAMAKAGLVLGALTVAILLLAAMPAAAIASVGAAMLGTSLGMLAIANALILFALVKWQSIAKAVVILGALTLAVGALMWVGGGPVGAATILAMGAALVAIALAGLMLNKVDWSSILKISAILAILVVGFAAFLAVITFFAPALIILSGFAGSIALLALALTGLALAFAVVFPLLAAGTGVFAAFATGAAVALGVFLTTLALQAPVMKRSVLIILQTIIDTIVEAVPMVIDGIKRLFSAIVKEFSGGGGGGGGKGVEASVGKSTTGWMTKITDSIKKKLPEIIAKAIEIGGKFIDGLTKRAPAIAAKGAELVIGLIKGIGSRIGGIVSAAADLIVKFAEGIGNNLGKIVNAGIQLIADWLHALADGIRNGSAAIGGGLKDVGNAFFDVGKNLVQGLIDGMKSLASKPLEWIDEIVGSLPGWARKMLGIASPSKVFKKIGQFLVEGLTKGIQDNAASSIVAVASMVSGTITVASEYVDEFIQKLDQKALAATAKAAGLQAAAAKAAKAAEKTQKNKKDDRKARQLQSEADKATRLAEKREAAAEKAKAASERATEFEEADLITKAQMRAEDATNTLDDAKAAEFEAESKRQQAEALREQAKKNGVSNKDAKEFRKLAEKLEDEAREDAKRANKLLGNARTQATEAMELQKQAAQAAIAEFDKRYADERIADEQDDAFNKMTDEEKAAERRRQAAELQVKADADLARARTLAYTDLDAANELAEQALEGADKARDYLREAAELEKRVADAKDQQSVQVGGEVVNLDPTEAASIAMGNYASTYDAAYAAAAGGVHNEFNQYNTSPEALNPTDVYRHTNNQFAFAADKLTPAA